jgi:hypothetical protein
VSKSSPLCPAERTSIRGVATSLMVQSRMGAVAWASRQRSVSHPRSSNRTCRSPASGSPTDFTARYTESKRTARGFGAVTNSPSPSTQQSPAAPVIVGVCRLIANHHDLAISKARQKSGPFPQPALPGFDGHTTLSDSRHGRRLRDVEAATLATTGLPRLLEPQSRSGPSSPELNLRWVSLKFARPHTQHRVVFLYPAFRRRALGFLGCA